MVLCRRAKGYEGPCLGERSGDSRGGVSAATSKYASASRLFSQTRKVGGFYTDKVAYVRPQRLSRLLIAACLVYLIISI